MFESKDEIREAVDRLIGFSAKHGKGDFIEISEVENVLGFQATTDYGRFCYIIRKWTVFMSKKRKIEIHWKKLEGFKLCTDEDCATWLPAMRRSKAFRQHGKALRSYGNIDMDRLTPNMRLAVSQGVEFSKQQRKELRKIKKTATRECEPSPRMALLPKS